MKKYIVAFLLLVPLAVPFISHALTQADLQAQIQALMAQLQALQSQQGTTDTSSSCLNLTSTLQYRSRDSQTNGQVSDLQDFLQTQGYLNSEPTGYFGLQTFIAVKAFQKANNLEQTGSTGPQTRAAINKISCSLSTTTSTTTVAPTTIVSTAPYATVTTPTLTLSYDSTSRESKLTSYSTTTITAGANPLYLPVKGIYISLGTNTNPDIGTTNSQQWDSRSLSTLSIGTNSYGSQYYIIPAGSSVTFVSSRISYPQQMFAGTYYATVAGVYAYSDTSLSNTFTIPSSANSSAGVTIIGETSPYITSASISSTGIVTATGQRLVGKGDLLNFYVDGSLASVTNVSPYSSSITFSLVKPLTIGYHNLQIENSEGKSNYANFQVSDSIVGSAQAKVSGNPTLTLSYDSTNKESSLVSFATTTITAGSNSIYLSAKGVYISVGTTVGSDNASTNSQQNNSYPVSPSTLTKVNGTYGQVFYVIPAGTSATFVSSRTLYPREMYAGTYYASISNVYAYSDINGLNTYTIPVNYNVSNKVVVMGEVSPYISSVTGTVDVNKAVTVTGARFNSNQVVVINNTKIKPTTVSADGTSLIFNPSSANIPVGTYYIYVSDSATGNSNTVRLELTGTVTGSVQAKIVGVPTLALQYDSTSKESILVGSATVQVTAGSSDLKMIGDFWLDLAAGGVAYSNLNSTQRSSVPLTTLSTTKDAYGRTVYIIPAGTSAQFALKRTDITKQLFAGTYTTSVWGGWYTGLNGDVQFPHITENNTSNAVTVVGEISPFISSISPISVSSGGTITLTGSRFGVTNLVYIDGVYQNQALASGNSTSITVTVPSTIFPGYHNLQIKDSTYGDSNNVTFQVQSTTTQPTITVISPNGGETWTPGSAQKITWGSTGIPMSNSMTVRLRDSAGIERYIYSQSGDVVPNYGFFSINVPTNLPEGKYKVEVKTAVNGQSYLDASDNYFTITSNSVQPTLTLTSPNGGEVISKANGPMPVTWTTVGVPSTNTINFTGRTNATGDANWDGKVDAFDQNMFAVAYPSVKGDAKYNPDVDFTNDGKIDTFDLNVFASNWQGTSDYNFGKTDNTGVTSAPISNLKVGRWKFKVETVVNGTTLSDWSNGIFTVTDGTTSSLDKTAQTAAILQSILDLLKQLQNQ